MTKQLSIILNGKKLDASFGAAIAELLPESPHRGRFPPLGVIINGRIDGLYYELKSDAEIETIDISRREGMDIYRRTATILLCAAMKNIDASANVVVGQSLSDNYFFEVRNRKVSSGLIRELEEKMKEFVRADIPLRREWTIIEEAIQLFEKEGQQDKVLLLNQYRRSEVPLVEIGQYHGIAYGPVAHRTSTIKQFKLHEYEHGIVLGFPDAAGNLEEKIKRQPKLFGTYVETKRWYELIGASNVAQLNDHCVKGTISDLVKVAEALHEKKIAAIADEIAKKRGVKLILIAGPSGSGKTTFTKRLAIQLKLHGIDPVSLSLDNYYVDREDTPKHPDGSFNFECIEALDLGLLNEHLKKLMNGETAGLPRYNFVMGKRDAGYSREVKLDKNQILMIEGIHGLNEMLSPAVKRELKYKIYVSALTQLSLDDHNRIFTSDTRLIRRIVRDRLFRGSGAVETFEVWPSVRMGEANYIFPYQEEADVMFNSALAYEPALMKPFAERFLMEVSRGDPAFSEATRLLRFFSFIVPILPQEVPHDSILREFIGGSAFRYT
jgi:uridine kinase